jgi:phosphatidylglycerol---prolipoprotein diacylglyceryl transferase
MLPILGRVGPFTIYSYGAMMALAFVAGALVARWYLPRKGVDASMVLDLVLAAAVGGLIGARVVYVATFPGEFAGHWLWAFELWRGGMVFYGGAAGGAIAVTALAAYRKLPLPVIADTAGLCLALGSAIGRLGCFLNGCCAGGPTDSWLGCTFPGSQQAVLPTQLFDAGAQLLIFGILLVVATRPDTRPGVVWWTYLTLYSIARFSVETLRTTTRYALGLSQAQWISLFVFVAGVAGLAWTLTRKGPASAEGGRPRD